MDKAELRQQLLEKRRAIPAAKRARDSLVLGQNVAAFLDACKVPANATIGVYAAMRDEANLAALIALLYADGATIAFPCAHAAENMEFYALAAHDLGEDAPGFIKEPGCFFPEEDCSGFLRITPEDFDVVLVPAVGFDKAKMRLGMGAGCYDRFLPKLKNSCITIGIVFDEQLVEKLPSEPHDRPVDYVISPSVAF